MRQFQWKEFELFGHKGYHLVCVSDPGPCPENPLGRQIVAEITFQRGQFGRQRHSYKARVYWDRGDDGRGHFPNDGRTLPNGADPSHYWPSSWAVVGNTKRAQRWCEEWLARWLWQWDDCKIAC